jgi:phospholipase/lecithinase/hemolysin
MYVFGDSLSETGNSLAITTAANAINPLIPIIPPSSVGYVNGRFANGSIWLDSLAAKLELGLPPISTLAGGASPNGVNFAINSATTGEKNTFPLPLPGFVGVQEQIAQFTTANASADPNALYIFWAGANDYLGAQVTEPTEPVANLSNAVEDLYAQGARHFLVANLPALGNTPIAQSQGSAVAKALNQVTAGHNFLLSRSLDHLSLLPEINLKLLDIASLFERAIQQPSVFGFTNVNSPCLVNSPLFHPPSAPISTCSNRDQYLFWDDLHPTSAAHRAIGELAFKTLTHQSVPEATPRWEVLAFVVLVASFFGSKRKSKRREKSFLYFKNS